jgi:hypothetical protein
MIYHLHGAHQTFSLPKKFEEYQLLFNTSSSLNCYPFNNLLSNTAFLPLNEK